MTEQDIRGHVLTIKGCFDKSKELEKQMRKARTGDEVTLVTHQIEEQKETALLAGLELATNLLVDINRIAEALEFVAKQHNNSEALFRG